MPEEEDLNVPTLKPNEKLVQLRKDLTINPDLRKRLAEDPSAVLDQYELSVVLPSGTLKRLQAGGGINLRVGGGGTHFDQHADGHLDVNPHIDQNPHIDLGVFREA